MNDNISRQQALDTIRNIRAITGTFDDEILLIDKAEAQTALMMLPPAESRKKGYWIKKEPTIKELHGFYYECSKCHKFSLPFQKLNFCPNCGTNMKEGKQNEID